MLCHAMLWCRYSTCCRIVDDRNPKPFKATQFHNKPRESSANHALIPNNTSIFSQPPLPDHAPPTQLPSNPHPTHRSLLIRHLLPQHQLPPQPQLHLLQLQLRPLRLQHPPLPVPLLRLNRLLQLPHPLPTKLVVPFL